MIPLDMDLELAECGVVEVAITKKTLIGAKGKIRGKRP